MVILSHNSRKSGADRIHRAMIVGCAREKNRFDTSTFSTRVGEREKPYVETFRTQNKGPWGPSELGAIAALPIFACDQTDREVFQTLLR